MSTAPELSPFLRTLFAERSDDLLALYAGAEANADLLHADFYTLRDLLELSGYETNEPVHVLLLALLLALDEGSLCVEASSDGLARRLAGLAEEPVVRAWATRAAACLEGEGLPELIGRSADEPRPVVLLEDGARKYLYFQKYLKHEEHLVEVLKKRLAAAATPVPGDLPAIVRDVLADNPLRLNAGQQTALGLALLRNLVLVSGGPGTGKTSVVVTLLRCLVRGGIAPERIALAAPTGRAAQRLTDAVRAGIGPDLALADITARTLHQLLRYHPGRGTFLHHGENPLPADVVVVDEVSMVGVRLMAGLFQALRPQTRLVLLGDKDQLASVDPGAVLANLLPSDDRPGFSETMGRALSGLFPGLDLALDPGHRPLQDVLVVLEENYRSQQEIQGVARAINAQDANVVGFLSSTSCQLLEQAVGSVSAWRGVLEQWAVQHYLGPGAGDYAALIARCALSGREVAPEQKAMLDALFGIVNRARILTLVREGPWGCEGVNRYLGQILRPRLDPGAVGLFAGMPVLVTRNDHARHLYNGDVGLALRSVGGGYRVVFPRLQEYVSFAADSLAGHEVALALTVHKSQGSEYDEVLLVLPPEGGRRLLTKEMIYTGVTRARRRVVIVGGREVLRSAVARRVERESALLQVLVR
jgi:exodeoxyribonuclease V alpha subunit